MKTMRMHAIGGFAVPQAVDVLEPELGIPRPSVFRFKVEAGIFCSEPLD